MTNKAINLMFFNIDNKIAIIKRICSNSCLISSKKSKNLTNFQFISYLNSILFNLNFN